MSHHQESAACSCSVPGLIMLAPLNEALTHVMWARIQQDTSMLIAVLGVQAPGITFPTPRSTMPNASYLWDILASNSLMINDPQLWDTSSPTATLSSPQSLSFDPSSAVIASCSDLCSSLGDSPVSSVSSGSSFEEVLCQLVATPSPGTAAAMVRSPPPSSRQSMETPGPDSAPAMVWNPSTGSSGQSVRTLRSDTVAALLRGLCSSTGQRLTIHLCPSTICACTYLPS